MKKLLLISTVLIFMACSKSHDDSAASKYAGNWSGTYKGVRTNGDIDSGTWTGIISSNDSLSIVTNSIVYAKVGGLSLSISGKIEANGSFNASVNGLPAGNYFKGTFTSTTVTGTWYEPITGDNDAWTGTLEGAK